MPETEVDPEDQLIALTNRLVKLVKNLVWLSVVLIVLVAGSFIRSFIVQHDVDQVGDSASQLQTTVEESKTASVEAKKELHDALVAAQQASAGPRASNEAIIDALKAIARIEVYLCGGPCPDKAE